MMSSISSCSDKSSWISEFWLVIATNLKEYMYAYVRAITMVPLLECTWFWLSIRINPWLCHCKFLGYSDKHPVLCLYLGFRVLLVSLSIDRSLYQTLKREMSGYNTFEDSAGLEGNVMAVWHTAQPRQMRWTRDVKWVQIWHLSYWHSTIRSTPGPTNIIAVST